MAALPVYRSAWSALLSAVIEEKPLMKPLAETSSWILVSASSAAGLDQALGLPAKMSLKTVGPPTRSNMNSSHIMEVQRDCPPRESGAIPMALNVATRDMRSDQVFGGWTLALAK